MLIQGLLWITLKILPQISVEYSTYYVDKSLKLIIIIPGSTITFWFIFYSF